MIYDKATNTVIYDVADPPTVLRAFPDARPIINGYVGIPAHLHNLQRLAASSISVPGPLDLGYDWPRDLSLVPNPFHAQRVMANFLALHPRSINLSEMRTGKTLAALWAADFVMRDFEAKGERVRALIVAPLRTLRRTWGNAVFHHFLGRRTCVVLHGDANKRDRLLADQDVDFYIINHDGLGVGAQVARKVTLTGMARSLFERSDIKIAIIDEASAYGDSTTRRSRIARTLIQDRQYFWPLTGTPNAQGPLKAYGISKLLNNAFGESYTSYKQRVMMQVSQFKWVPRAGAAQEVVKLLQPAVRFRQDEVFDAPDCIISQEEAPLSIAQKKAYKKMKDELVLEQANGKRITAVNEGVLRWKLIQIACGAVYDSDHEVHELDIKPRLEVMKELIEEAPRKIIIFAPLTSVLNLLHKELSKDYSCVLVNGEVPNKEADARVAQFQEGREPRILIAHPGPIARGLDFTAAATIIWYAPTDKTEDYIQANQRINGPKQTHKRAIIQISGSPIEQEIYKRLEANETLQGVVLKLVENGAMG